LELGSFADLLSGFGTVAALVAASVAARAAIKTNNQQGVQLRHLEEAEKERREREEQRVAGVVAAWAGMDDNGAIVRFVNGSGLPVYDLSIWVLTPDRLFCVEYATHGPTSNSRPLRRVGIDLNTYATDADVWASWLNEGKFRAAAVFRDTTNKWWLRGFDGSLSQQPDRQTAHRSVKAEHARFSPGP
jgi:hypothetical protein